jgi:serine/threonine-protein kinase
VLPNDWADLSPLVDRLLDTPASERSALLDDLAKGNPTRRSALERLVADCERDVPLLDRPAFERFSSLQEEDAGPSLPDVIGGRYRIERELGRGGMARVYLAYDSRHDRRVAVKVIRHEIASSLGHDRFLREIGIAARLRHPNVMPLYDSGDVDGLLYFVMPYEEGNSLRARLDRDGNLGIAEAVSILRDVARALACAHEQGVVHRDIKPDNVLLSGDAAVVTDFGIAKALTIAATETGTGSFTQAGTVIGTPAYMSPEQAIGDPTTDHRADIYAFGCLAYELFAGAPPFTGATTHEIISAKLSQSVKPLTDRRPDAPEAVARLIARCLERDPAARPASANELLDVLGTMPATKEPAVRRRRWLPQLAAALALSAMSLGGWYAARMIRGGPVTITVLPLQVKGDSLSVAEPFSDNLAMALSKFGWLTVKSRFGAGKYGGRGDIAPRAWGDSLGARYLVGGSFREDRDSIAVTLQLIRSKDGALVWGQKFTERPNLEELRDRIARAIADTLRPIAGRFANRFPVDTTHQRYGPTDDAYTLLLRGNRKLAERGQSIGQSIRFFRQAIELDSTSAQAWSGLSLALAISAINQNASVDSVRPEAIESAKHALRLDDDLSEPHVAMAVVHSLYWRWKQAEDEFKEALRLKPQDLEARIQYTRVLFGQGRIAEAHQQIDTALFWEPASSLVLSFKSNAYFLQGDNKRAMTWSNRATQLDSANFVARIFRAMLLVRDGQPAKARQLVQDSSSVEPYSLYVLAVTGDSVKVRRRLAELTERGNRSAAPWTARAYALFGLGDTAGALDALKHATDNREIWPNISPDGLPVFDAVRDNPRYQALRKQVGFSAP